MPFSSYIGNARIAATLRRLSAEGGLPQTLLFAGPHGVGKATLARFLAAASNCAASSGGDFCGVCSHCVRVLAADVSKPEFRQQVEEREKLPAQKRSENPLVLATHPDFLIFPPDGPLRLIGIEQARLLRHMAQLAPSEGRRRFFVIDHADRANAEAANSLLKTLEEPAPSLTIVLTAENPFQLLPTIRSRSVPFWFSPLTPEEMERFFDSRPESSSAERTRLRDWAQGSPGRALALDSGEYLERRGAMMALLETAAGQASFADLIGRTEAAARKQGQRLSQLVEMLQGLLGDLLRLGHGSNRLVNSDITGELQALAGRVSFAWLESAAARLAELERLERRNIQKQMALEAFAVEMRRQTV